ncbi:MAG: iron-containing alcohol dehydrogenase [Thermomicrobiales bacterium]|nr:iron-containing alcohol dehydrogenase [Thermomicrobiales bacterium]
MAAERLEQVFQMDTSGIKVGRGATREVGADMARLGARRVMVLTDPGLAGGATVATVTAALRAAGLDAALYDRVRVEPTDASFAEAIAFAAAGRFDGFVAVGGGSTMDTAKAANLYATWPAALLTYVNPPIGAGAPVPGPLKPLIAIPTTAGTGSETTGVAIFDLEAMHAKTGIAHRALRPALGIIDADNTRTMPPMVAACSGLDVLSHALESYTALPYHRRPAATEPGLRPAYQGANPISDIWSAQAIAMLSGHLQRAVDDPTDDEAREQMLLASAFAGIGFGNAGVHLPHGMSYPVSGMVRSFVAAGYPADRPLIPHGMSVILNAPSVFRWAAAADPARHLEAARMLGADPRGAAAEDAGTILADTLIGIMRRVGMPSGLAAVGFSEADVPALVEGTLPQHRVTKLAPRPAAADDLAALFRGAMRYW